MVVGDGKVVRFSIRPTSPPAESRPINEAPLRVLIVDGSSDQRMAVRTALEADGYLLSEVDDGTKALATVGALQPDCVLLDDHLPDVNDRNVLDLLRRSDGSMPCAVVILTSSEQADSLGRSRDPGEFDTFNRRQVADVSLSRTVRAAVERHRLLEQRRRTAERDAHLAALLESSDDAIISTDIEDRVKTWNPRAVTLFGFAEHEAVGRKLDELVVPDDLIQQRQKLYQDVKQGRVAIKCESRRRRKDGGSVEVEIRAAPIFDANGNVDGLCFIKRDITDRKTTEDGLVQDISTRKQAEAALAESEQRLRDVLNGMDEAFGLMDRDFRILMQNEAALRLDGRTSGEIFGRTHWEVYPGSEHSKLGQLYKRAMSERIPVALEHQSRRDGEPARWLDMRAYPVPEGLAVFWRDITGRKQAEQSLIAAHATMRHLVDHSPFGIYMVDADFRLVQVSEGAQSVFRNVRPLIGRDFADVLRIVWPEPFASEAIERFRHTLATGEAYHSPSTVEQRGDIPSKEAYDWKLERVTLMDGRPGVVCHFYDLSERQRHEEHVQHLMREVNHRAKNMLTLVQAIARRTAATRPDDFIAYFNQRVRALAANQDLLVKNEWKAIPLRDLVRSQLAHFDDTRIVIDGLSVEINAWAAQSLGLALHELATNAVKYGALSNDSGQVEISWEVSHGEDGPRFSMSWVEKAGPAVEPPTRQGFGSTVIGGMVKMSLGCDVRIDYRPSGLTWRIECPVDKVAEGGRASIAAHETGDAAVSGLPSTHHQRRVLVLEDEPLIAMDVAAALSDAGWSVIGPASTVAQALALLRTIGCDAAVLDTNIGAETAEPVAAELVRSGTPFITVSGYSHEQQPEIMKKGLVMSKPVERERLVAAIGRCLVR
ncbi:PAS domain S-box protein [Bradyrhizobium sp. HKCCYLS2038]|uniref:PAS domain S-box protein n=1 Tax=unclassified Bradyrhizobium TaxID=2631580 RepID=UPI003EB98FFD